MKKLFIVLLSLAILGLIIIKFIDINTLPLRPYKLSKLPFILIISSLLSILSLLSIEKKIVFLSIFSLAGIFIVSSVALSFLFNTEDFEKIDYCFSQKVENYEYKKYVDEFNWTNERFILIKMIQFILLTHPIKTITEKKNIVFGKVYFNNFII